MSFRFRKIIKIAPGLRINLSKKGLSSLSIGKRGATLNIGRTATRATVGIPGSGLSYSTNLSTEHSSKNQSKPTPTLDRSHQQPLSDDDAVSHTRPLYRDTPSSDHDPQQRKVTPLLAIAIFFFPVIFSWFTLRKGYSTTSRLVSMGWVLSLAVLSLLL